MNDEGDAIAIHYSLLNKKPSVVVRRVADFSLGQNEGRRIQRMKGERKFAAPTLLVLSLRRLRHCMQHTRVNDMPLGEYFAAWT